MKKKEQKPSPGTDSKTSGPLTSPRISIRRFGITYLILMGAFFLLIGLKPVQDFIDLNGLYSRGVVILTSEILGGLSIPCTSQGSILKLPSIALDVRFGCNGLEAVLIYAIAVIAFPATWRKRLLGIAGGFIVLQGINVLRIVSLAYSAIYFKNLFQYVHIYVAQGLMIAIALGIFFVYLNYAKSPQKTRL